MKRIWLLAMGLLIAVLVISGCSKKEQGGEITGDSNSMSPAAKTIAAEKARFPPSAELQPYVDQSAKLPAAEGIADARKNVKEGDVVLVSGRVKDFVNGKAMFTMVDSKIPSCEETMPGEPEPWDYCCQPKNELAANMATVKLVKAGTEEVIPGNLEGVNNLDHLTTVVVEGKATRDNGGNLIVAATKVYLKK